MDARERRAFNREVYGLEGRSQQEIQERSKRSRTARAKAQGMGLPQQLIDRAASFAADGGTPEDAIRLAIQRDDAAQQFAAMLDREQASIANADIKRGYSLK